MKVALIILSIIYIIFWVSVFIHTLNDSTSKASKTKWGVFIWIAIFLLLHYIVLLPSCSKIIPEPIEPDPICCKKILSGQNDLFCDSGLLFFSYRDTCTWAVSRSECITDSVKLDSMRLGLFNGLFICE
jgi:hypothetical protein